MNTDLKERLIILTSYNKSNLSLFTGECADLMLLLEYFNVHEDNEIRNIIINKIEYIINNISKCNSFNFANGYAGILYTLLIAKNKKFYVSLNENFYNSLDYHFNKIIDNLYDKSNYDLQFGLIGIGLYYIELSRYYPKKAIVLKKIIDKIIRMSKKNNDLLYWNYNIENTNTNDPTINLGALHGQPSILCFLNICYKEGHFKDIEFLNRVIFSLNHFKLTDKEYIFSTNCQIRDNKILIPEQYTGLNFCYGDLGVILGLLNLVGHSYSAYLNEIINLMTTSIHKRLIKGYKYDNCSICHGWAGLNIYLKNINTYFSSFKCDDLSAKTLKIIISSLFNDNKIPISILTGHHSVWFSYLYSDNISLINRILLIK